MKIFSSLLALAGAIALAPAATAVTPLPYAVSATEAGAVTIGDAAAKVRLIEYISYTCPHCAQFNGEAHAELIRDYVQPRTTAIEVRNLVRDPFDMAAALLARCGGPGRFVPLHNAILAAQDSWLGKARAATPAQQKAWTTGTIEARLVAIGRGTGLTAIAGRHGITPAAAAKCLSSKTERDRLVAMTEQARTLGVTGTPSFIIGGALTDVHDWAGLKPLLDTATR